MKRFKKVSMVLTAAVCALTISACGNDNKVNDNQDPLTGEEMSGSGESSQEAPQDDMSGEYKGRDGFDSITQSAKDPSEVMDYINTNIANAAEGDIDYFFRGLFDFGDDIRNIDFTMMDDSRQYMPEDVIAFSDLMKLEHGTPSMVMSDEENRRVINMTLSEMLERALLFEQHLVKYPNNTTTEAAQRLYEEIATSAISGGYNKTEGIAHYYKGESDDVVDSEALQYYKQFADANPDSLLGKVVKEYITLLESNNFAIDEKLEDFYMSLHEKLDIVGVMTDDDPSNDISVTPVQNDGAAGVNQNAGNANTDKTNTDNTDKTNTDKTNTENTTAGSTNNTGKTNSN